jgi:WD40 repeat protein
MARLPEADKLLEIARDELAASIGDDPRSDLGVSFACPLQDNFRVGFLHVLRGHDGRINAVAISPDNRWLVTGSLDKTARLWDLNAKDPAANPVVLRDYEGLVSAWRSARTTVGLSPVAGTRRRNSGI